MASANIPGEIKSEKFGGIHVHYRDVGHGAPLVFLHNGGSHHGIWRRQIDAFAATHRCLAIDLPGFGRSGDSHRFYELKTYVDVLRDFVSAISGKVTLIGNCMGSAISLGFARSQPEQVRRLILFNLLTGATVSEGMLGPLFVHFRKQRALRLRLRRVIGQKPIPRILIDRVLKIQFGVDGVLDGEMVQSLRQLYRMPGSLGALLDIWVDLDSYLSLDQVRQSEDLPPTLVVWGEDNKLLPLQAGKSACERIGLNTFAVIEGAGHLAMYERPAVSNHLIRNFVNIHK